MELQVRLVDEAELTAFCLAMSNGFLRPLADAQAEADARRPAMHWDRTWAGFDGDAMVSTLRSFPTELTVPGGTTVPASAVTAVTTTATHRRRGLASRMMLADLRASQERGEVAAVLHASEWEIYGRFGFGPATQTCELVVDSHTAGFRSPVEGTAELVDRDTARALLPDVYDTYRRGSPGEIARTGRFLDTNLGIVRYPSWGELTPGFHVAVRDAGGAVVGVARYEVDDRWERGRPEHVLSCGLFVATGSTGHALLWQYLLGLDLVAEVRVQPASVVDPLPFLLTDGRAARYTDISDSIWLRLLDVPAALAARRYLTSGTLVLEVPDRLRLAGGRYRLDGGPDGASCTRTDDPADLTLDVGTLGAAYLGGTHVRSLASAGLVDEHTAGGIRTADAMFRSDVPPLCTTMF